MKYNYRFTKDLDEALDWVLQNQFKDNVSYRFTFETYRSVRRTPWMSSKQCLDYIRYFRVDDDFKNITQRVAK